jgi:hypothetical protein
MKRLISILAVIAFLGLAAYAKSLDFDLTSTTKVGALTLGAGHYECKVDGNTATINGPHAKHVTLPVKTIEGGEAKVNHPVLGFHKEDNGDQRLVSIGWAGSTAKVVFLQ